MENKKLLEPEIEIAHGYRIDKGMVSANFSTSTFIQSIKAELENPLVLLVEEQIKNIEGLAPFLEFAAVEKRPLLIIAKKISEQVIAYLLLNNSKGTTKICAIENPQEELLTTGSFHDLAAMTHANIIGTNMGLPIENADKGI